MVGRGHLFEMNKMSIQQVGGIGAAVAYLSISLFFFLVIYGSSITLEQETSNVVFIFADYCLVLFGISGLAVVPAISRRVLRFSPGLINWVSLLAQLGFSLLAVMSVWQAEYESSLIVQSRDMPVVTYDPVQGHAIDSPSMLLMIWQGVTTRIPQGWLDCAGIGLWILTVSWLARDAGLLPLGMVQVGMAAGISAISASAGSAVQLSFIHLTGNIGLLLFYPLWFGWAAIFLIKRENTLRRARLARVTLDTLPHPLLENIAHPVK